MTAPAGAVSFNLIDTGGAAIGTKARQGFEMATGYWSSVLTDDITITLSIGYSALSAGILGSTSSTSVVIGVGDTYDALAVDVTSTLDTTAVANLQPLSTVASGEFAGKESLSFTTNALNRANTGYLDTGTRTDDNGSANNVALYMTLANSQSLGFTTDYNGAAIDYSKSAGSILFSSNFSFDFDATDGISTGSYDFVGVAVHEIGHALGFVSGVDTYDLYTYPGNATNRTSGALDGYAVNSTLDLFRYSGEDQLDVSTSSSDKYFSIDGGDTEVFGESSFSTGVYNGDGRQASHWKDNVTGEPQEGILDPSVVSGYTMEVTALDLAAFDAIGWDVDFDVLANPNYVRTTAEIFASAVPEPATWLQMLFGFALTGVAIRRRSRAAGMIAA